MKIHILLSTYNGEAFLAEQIESIQAQTVTDWTLLIRDDGSSDSTPDVIEQFVQADSRIRFINREHRVNVGVIKSFYELVHTEKADVYFFSDQDDVWLPEKMELTLAEAAKYDGSEPLLVYTDLKVVDQDLDVLVESMVTKQSHHGNTRLVEELTENTVTGGTMMINHALAELWQTTEPVLMHDWYLALLAAACGHLVYLPVPTELYRQHGKNVLGARTWSKYLGFVLAFPRLVSKYWTLIKGSQAQARAVAGFPLSAEKKEVIEAYIEVLDQPLWERWQTLRRYGLRKNKLLHTVIFTTLIVTKLGYKE